MNTTKRIVAVFALLSMGACDSPYERVDPATGIPLLPEPSAMVQSSRAGLSVSAELSKTNCRAIGEVLRASAIRLAYSRVQQAFASAWQQKEKWCDYDYPSYAGADGGAMADSSAASPAPGETPEHSDTNNQVASVDEADVAAGDPLLAVERGDG